MILYFAPGAGLGHLNRALAVCLGLREAGVDARIVTDSLFAEGLAGLSRCPFLQIPLDVWVEGVKTLRPGVVITDTFPYGRFEEWRTLRGDAPVIHIARRLRVAPVLDATDFAAMIQAEPLSPAHEAALGCAVRLPGPIRLLPGAVPTPIPKVLRRPGLELIVHSGGEDELAVLRLVAPRAVIVSPWPGHVEYYPTVNVMGEARRVITGGGYNCMADLLAHRDRHVAVPFERRFDDQQARVEGFFPSAADGTALALRTILGFTRSAR